MSAVRRPHSGPRTQRHLHKTAHSAGSEAAEAAAAQPAAEAAAVAEAPEPEEAAAAAAPEPAAAAAVEAQPAAVQPEARQQAEARAPGTCWPGPRRPQRHHV